MLKNTKVVGIAAAIALLTGVAFAPGASAVGSNKPSQSLDGGSNFDAGERIDYFVDDVRTGCAVTTTVGNNSKTVKAKRDLALEVVTFGDVNSFIAAPSIAGEYTVASMVSKSCKDDAGYKVGYDMAEDITVGDDVLMDGSFEDVVNTTAGGLTGTMENATVAEDLGKTKISVYRLGVLVASGTTNNAGEFSLQIAKKHFRAAGDTRFTVKISANSLWYLEDGLQVIFANINDIV